MGRTAPSLITPNSSGRPNRVRPDGELVADAARGLLWGNRGQLLDRDGRLARHSRGRLWLICVLDFHGRRRTQWQPRRLTELYFVDEATGLAAGHRPCGECRHADHQAFKRAWQQRFPGDGRADDLDRRLHADRLEAPGAHRTHRRARSEVPDGAMVVLDADFWLVWQGSLRPWSPTGYGPARRGRVPAHLEVLTPAATVEALSHGYRPLVHPTAG